MLSMTKILRRLCEVIAFLCIVTLLFNAYYWKISGLFAITPALIMFVIIKIYVRLE